MNYRASDGTWRKIAESLASDEAGGWTNAGGPYSVHFPASLSPTAPLTLELPEGTITTHPTDLAAAAGVAGALEGHEVIYPGALTQTDLVYSLTPSGFKELVVLKAPAAPQAVAYEIIVSTGLSLRLGEAGEVEIVSGGQAVGFIPTPVAYDSSEEMAQSTGSYVLLPQGPDRYLLTLAIDPAYLATATYR